LKGEVLSGWSGFSADRGGRRLADLDDSLGGAGSAVIRTGGAEATWYLPVSGLK
jgi:hypothetical protein